MTVYCDYDSCEYYEDGCCYNDRIFLSEIGECKSYRQKIEEDENDDCLECGADMRNDSNLMGTEVEGLFLNFEQEE